MIWFGLIIAASIIAYHLGKAHSDLVNAEALKIAANAYKKIEEDLRAQYIEKTVLRRQLMGYMIDAMRWRAQRKNEKLSS